MPLLPYFDIDGFVGFVSSRAVSVGGFKTLPVNKRRAGGCPAQHCVQIMCIFDHTLLWYELTYNVVYKLSTRRVTTGLLYFFQC